MNSVLDNFFRFLGAVGGLLYHVLYQIDEVLSLQLILSVVQNAGPVFRSGWTELRDGK